MQTLNEFLIPLRLDLIQEEQVSEDVRFDVQICGEDFIC